jgi:hypothetical protein
VYVFYRQISYNDFTCGVCRAFLDYVFGDDGYCGFSYVFYSVEIENREDGGVDFCRYDDFLIVLVQGEFEPVVDCYVSEGGFYHGIGWVSGLIRWLSRPRML